MKKILSTKKNKAGRYVWLVTEIKGKTKRIIAQSGKGVDYATAHGAKRAFWALVENPVTDSTSD